MTPKAGSVSSNPAERAIKSICYFDNAVGWPAVRMLVRKTKSKISLFPRCFGSLRQIRRPASMTGKVLNKLTDKTGRTEKIWRARPSTIGSPNTDC